MNVIDPLVTLQTNFLADCAREKPLQDSMPPI